VTPPATRLLGLLGGMSWVSSADLYRRINEGVARQMGGLHSARLLLHSVDFAPVAAWQARQDWVAAGEHLGEAAAGLKAAGAEGLMLLTNTMHQVADAIEARGGLPLLHLVDITAAALKQRGVRRVGLLGTRFTMELPFYADRLVRHGMSLSVPDTEGRAAVHAAIYDELCHGRVSDATRALLKAQAATLLDGGADAVVLGCTELGLALGESTSVIDSTRLQAEAAVDWLCQHNPDT
jgi:aspartate racemase